MVTSGSRPSVMERANLRDPLFLEQHDHPLIFRHKRVDPSRLTVQKGRDGALFGEGREGRESIPNLIGAYPWHLDSIGEYVDPVDI